MQSARAAMESGHAGVEPVVEASAHRTSRMMSSTSETPSPFRSQLGAGAVTQILPAPRAKVGHIGSEPPAASATIVAVSRTRKVCGGVSGATE